MDTSKNVTMVEIRKYGMEQQIRQIVSRDNRLVARTNSRPIVVE